MNALQQRMMANAGMLSEEMEGGVLPSQRSIRTTTRNYDEDNLQLISTSRKRVPGIGPVTANNPRIIRQPRMTVEQKLADQLVKDAWKAENPVAWARLQAAQLVRREYAEMRRNGDFDGVLRLKERRKAEARQRSAEAKAARGGQPAELTPALRAAQAARQWKSQLREMFGKAAADKYVEALKLSRRTGSKMIAVDKVLVDPSNLESLREHYQGVLIRREAAKDPALLAERATIRAEKRAEKEAVRGLASRRKPPRKAKAPVKSRKSKKPTQAAAE